MYKRQLQLNANSGALKYEGISQKDWTERILSALSAEYADGGIQSQEPLKNITDKNGNVVYTDVADTVSYTHLSTAQKNLNKADKKDA